MEDRGVVRADAEPGSVPGWYLMDAGRVFLELESSPSGLDRDEADRRLRLYGSNQLDFDHGVPAWRVLVHQFMSPLIGMLALCAVVVLIQQHWVDAAAILFALAVNAALGFWQERKAEKDVRALKSLAVDYSDVLRNGARISVPAAELTRGDVVLLESGDRVPADLRLFDLNSLQVNESMLTGEVYAVTKRPEALTGEAAISDQANMAFSGSLVVSGRGSGIVVATGGATELGAINRMVQGPAGKTPLQLLTDSLEKRVGIVIAVACLLVFVAGMVLGKDASEMFRTVVALAVSAIPESLPVVLTVALSIGVSRMARHHAVVRTLPAVETLGSTTVIGSDKTGTLTQNRLTVEKIWTCDGSFDLTPGDSPPQNSVAARVLRAGALTNEAEPHPELVGEFVGDAVDAAMALAAVTCGTVSHEERSRGIVAHMPYEPHHRYSQTVRRTSGQRILYVKGAPDTIAAMSRTMASSRGPVPLDPELVDQANEAFARDGLRVIAVGVRYLSENEEIGEALGFPGGLEFLGLEAMTDPPRHGVSDAVAACRSAGIDVKMITGDHPVTASAIGRRLGLDTSSRPLTGPEMHNLDNGMLAARLRQTSIAARVTPHDKLRIVQVLQDEGHTVAVTGDGVNDAPALKAASIGVAMGKSGTDVAREASDLVLTDDNFVTIVHAVEQGRITFAAIRKATYFLLATGLASLTAVSVNVMSDLPLLFLPVQLLWINIVTNGVQDIALAFEPGEGDELRRKPRNRDEGLLSAVLWWRTGLVGVWIAVSMLLMFHWAIQAGYELEHARTLAITLFVMCNFYLVMTARSERSSFFRLRPFANPLLFSASFLALFLHWGTMHWPPSAGILGFTPLSWTEWLACVVLGSAVFFVVEVDKFIRRVIDKRQTQVPDTPRVQPRTSR